MFRIRASFSDSLYWPRTSLHDETQHFHGSSNAVTKEADGHEPPDVAAAWNSLWQKHQRQRGQEDELRSRVLPVLNGSGPGHGDVFSADGGLSENLAADLLLFIVSERYQYVDAAQFAAGPTFLAL